MRPPFPAALDSTIIGTFRSCPQKAFRMYLEHWKPRVDSVHLIAGGAFAAGLEVARRAYYEDGRSAEDSQALALGALLRAYGPFECPADSAKSPHRMAGALEYYFSQYPLATDEAKPALIGGRHAIEFSFAEPLNIAHPETGEPILYTGRTDMIADFAGGLWIEDDKTTGSLGARWSGQWDLRSQFTGSCWAARRNRIKVDGVLVRGIAIRKEGFDTAQVISSRSEWEIERWLLQVRRDVVRMIACWRSGIWDYNLDHACTEYGGCVLRQICRTQDPAPWLEIDFERRIWDPLIRTETLL